MDAATLEKKVLNRLAESDCIEDTYAEASALGVSHQEMVGVVKSLWTDEYVTMNASVRNWLVLTAEGEEVSINGSPEARVFEYVKNKGATTMGDMETALGKEVAKLGMGAAMKEKWLKKQSDTFVPGVDAIVDSVAISLRELKLNKLPTTTQEKNLTRRKLAAKQSLTYYKVERGRKFAIQRAKKVGDLNIDSLKDGSWKTAEFKAYNFDALGAPVTGGYIQPLLKVRAEFRRILMGMGFTEMPTNRWVESSFWNFDALFQPQSHPARDAHDTFFIKEPRLALSWPEQYYERVKTMHEEGGAGSLGHRCIFDSEEAAKNLLRTHTTAVSARMLYKLAEQNLKSEGSFKPTKLFSIDRVFRNESMDSTHLCEFHQVEGLVADYDLSLGHLIATIRTFFEKIGITQLRFKPAFNPYTEPSMEVFGYHPDLKRWTEIGNSGSFFFLHPLFY
mmetsp:Transcript_4526/g.6422  ORF Transcript_4526/g.6422 Transcript_4526/m.6422 type:complete len:448 (+) Transcript_4526:307-1650(+)